VKKKPTFNQNASIRGALRRMFARSPVIRDVMHKVRREVPRYNKDGSRAKKDAVQYLCAVCGTWTGSMSISVDHIAPVVAVEVGFIDWNQFVARLFCGPENLQVICDTCHNQKTNAERIARLTKQYTLELDELERTLDSSSLPLTLKTLKKYIAKSKTPGLQLIVERAKGLRDKILIKRS
jgi:5-methylcytosine-specific restriction endonuclease McrA